MTANDSSFNQMAAQAKQDYPEETKDIFFINLSAPDARARLQQWFEHLTDAERRAIRNNYKASDKDIIDNILHGKGLADIRLLAVAANARNTLLKDTGKNAAFTFFHELGHLLFQHVIAGKNDDLNTAEAQADSFAALMGLKQGWLTIDDIRHISAARELYEKKGHNTHITSPALDSLVTIYDAAIAALLSPDEIKGIAEQHGKAFTAPLSRIETATALSEHRQEKAGDLRLQRMMRDIFSM